MMIEVNIIELLVFLGIPSAFTGFCFWLLKRHIEKREKKAEEREKVREENEIHLVKAVWASIALGEAAACALKNGKCNGETEKALEYASKVKQEQRDFLAKQGIHAMF